MAIQPQIKICGIKDLKTALACERLGADALGFVFYPKSPRFITPEKAKGVIEGLSKSILPVGVFVNVSFDFMMECADISGIKGVQLHGNESPELCRKLLGQSLKVYKALFLNGTPGFDDTLQYEATGFLAECQKGPLPGGNAVSWEWKKARHLGKKHGLILAGGLTPENVADAMASAMPGALDVSSGVESAPGVKDLLKIEQFISSVRSFKTYDGMNPTNKRSIF